MPAGAAQAAAAARASSVAQARARARPPLIRSPRARAPSPQHKGTSAPMPKAKAVAMPKLELILITSNRGAKEALDSSTLESTAGGARRWAGRCAAAAQQGLPPFESSVEAHASSPNWLALGLEKNTAVPVPTKTNRAMALQAGGQEADGSWVGAGEQLRAERARRAVALAAGRCAPAGPSCRRGTADTDLGAAAGSWAVGSGVPAASARLHRADGRRRRRRPGRHCRQDGTHTNSATTARRLTCGLSAVAFRLSTLACQTLGAMVPARGQREAARSGRCAGAPDRCVPRDGCRIWAAHADSGLGFDCGRGRARLKTRDTALLL